MTPGPVVPVPDLESGSLDESDAWIGVSAARFISSAFKSCAEELAVILRGFIAKIGDVWDVNRYAKRIAAAIDKAFQVSPEQKKKMLSNNRQHLLGRFSADSMAENYYRLLCRLTMG